MRRPGLVTLAALAASALLLAGCTGGDSGVGDTPVINKTVEKPPPTAETTPPPTTTTTPPASDEATFQTPTKNIGCRIDAETATCGIGEFDFQPPDQPADCDLPGWGHVIGVDRFGSGDFICSDGLVAPPDAKVLPYGQGLLLDSFACGSSADGVRCANRDTRHGFFISRQQARIF